MNDMNEIMKPGQGKAAESMFFSAAVIGLCVIALIAIIAMRLI